MYMCVYVYNNAKGLRYTCFMKLTCWLYIYGLCDIGGTGGDKPADGSNNLFGFPAKQSQLIFI